MPDSIFYPQFNNEAVSILAAAIVATMLLNLIPLFSYPFYLFFTMIHELGHVFATRLSGGKVVAFWVFPDATGLSRREGGDHYLVIPAGYMGVTLFSAGLILLTGLSNLAPYILGLIGGLLILFIMLYSSITPPDEKDPRTSVTAIVGLAFSVLFIGVAWLADLRWSMFLLNLLAIQGTFTSFENLENLADQVRQKMKDIDPDRMAQEAGLSPMFWVWVWSLLSIVILGAVFWFTWLRNLPTLLNSG